MIERLEAFEERAGVRLEALSAFAQVDDEEEDTYYITVRGEVHSRAGTTLSQDVVLGLTVYDRAGRVVETGGKFCDQEKFFGFETFEITCSGVVNGFSRFRLLPKVN